MKKSQSLVNLKFKLNGKLVEIKTTANKRLLDLLRDDLNLTGTKEGCSIGECGACTVIMNGKAVNSCLVLAPEINDAEVITIEGISQNGNLHPLQENFLKHGAVQCGFCIPGMILSAYALLQKNPKPDEEMIKEAIAGNLCRCTGYKQIIEAIKESVSE